MMGDYRSLKLYATDKAAKGADDEVKMLNLAELNFNKGTFEKTIEFLHRVQPENIIDEV